MRPQAGYALIVILLLLALVLISLSTAVRPVLTEAQRQKEDELIFRGEQYKRSIGRFYRKFGRYPLKMDELIRTNDRSFLRRPFPDPMTPDGKWRLIRVGLSGQLIGSKHEQKPTAKPSSGQPPQPPASASGSSDSSSGPVNAPIVGVASNSTARSIRVLDGYQRYDQWEFVYDPVKEAMRLPAGAGAAPTPGADSSDKSKTKPKPSN